MRLFEIFLLGFLLSTITFLTADSNNAFQRKIGLVTKEISSWIKSGIKSNSFNGMIEALAFPTALQHQDWKAAEGIHAVTVCTVCKLLVNTVISSRRKGTPVDVIAKTVGELCTLLNLQAPEVCVGVVNLNAPIILKIVDSKPRIRARDVCGVILQSKECPIFSKEYEWSILVDNNPPKNITVTETDRTIKIAQITDIHYDPKYEVNGNAYCKEPTCCRAGQNATNSKGKLAGYWGDYHHCDSPWHSVVDSLRQVSNNHKDIEHIYFTGDIIDHGVWATTRVGNRESLLKTYNLIQKFFPNKKVYPILGNHEPSPLNTFAPHDIADEELSTVWLYKLMADLWIGYGWLPESTRSTILRGGFYTVSPRKGFRIIALNNNVCYTYNWWLLYQPKDQDGQLTWLMETLLKAEQDSEFVHILAHIPPGDHSCFFVWSREYRKIVNRFYHIIAAQFNGHTHNEELRVFYDPVDKTKILNAAWNGGSITPYVNLNPNYKIYDISLSDYSVVDYDMWTYDLACANEAPNRNPEWYKLYSFKEEYNLIDTSPASLNDWLVQMSKNDTMIKQYHQNFVKRADPSLKKDCNAECLKKRFCSIVTSEVHNDKDCKFFINLNNPFYQATHKKKESQAITNISL